MPRGLEIACEGRPRIPHVQSHWEPGSMAQSRDNMRFCLPGPRQHNVLEAPAPWSFSEGLLSPSMLTGPGRDMHTFICLRNTRLQACLLSLCCLSWRSLVKNCFGPKEEVGVGLGWGGVRHLQCPTTQQPNNRYQGLPWLCPYLQDGKQSPWENSGKLHTLVKHEANLCQVCLLSSLSISVLSCRKCLSNLSR